MMLKITTYTVTFLLFFAIFVMVVNVALEKEADRMDAVRDYNCAHYGAAINKHAGKEICPPTPQG